MFFADPTRAYVFCRPYTRLLLSVNAYVFCRPYTRLLLSVNAYVFCGPAPFPLLLSAG